MSLVVECRCGGRFAAQPHLAGQRVACPNCGQALVGPQVATPTYGFVGAQTPVRQPSRRELKQRFNQLNLMFGVPGFFIQIGAVVLDRLISHSPEPSPLALLAMMVGTVLYITGLCFYAKSKGHTPVYGIVGLTGLCGISLLALPDDRLKD